MALATAATTPQMANAEPRIAVPAAVATIMDRSALKSVESATSVLGLSAAFN
jgi:hypothetical protein